MIWRARRVSQWTLVFLAVLSLAALVSVETFKVEKRQEHYNLKLAAATRMELAMEIIRSQRILLQGYINRKVDPADTGMIGLEFSEITSDAGDLEAKQTSANPNLAALLVQWLKRANLESGDIVAVAMSGSFPAGNIAVLVACEALGLQPLVISSTSGSMYGANLPALTWLDMESLLIHSNLIKAKSIAATIGGGEDTGLSLSPRGRDLLLENIKKNGVPFLEPNSLTDSVEKRMALYREKAQGKPIKMYVNVGGGLGSIGARVNMQLIKPGLTLRPRKGIYVIHGPMTLFGEEGVPVINLNYMKSLAQRFGLPVGPKQRPAAGDSELFSRQQYNLWLLCAILASLSAVTFLVIRVDMGHYLVRLHRLYAMKQQAS